MENLKTNILAVEVISFINNTSKFIEKFFYIK